MSLIYLDNSATSFPKAPGVKEAILEALSHAGTSGRASYEEAVKGSKILYTCRKNIARLLGVENCSQIIFTSGTTESLNTVLKGFLKKGMRVLTSSAEHNSVMRVLSFLQSDRQVELYRFANAIDGSADLNSYGEFLKEFPDLVVLCHSSNVTGAIYPLKEMIESAHKAGALVCIDGAQSAGHEEIDLMDLEADFFCFSGHKGLLGPAGTGGFYIREGLEIQTLIHGGTGSLSEEEKQPEMLPDRYESGTQNIHGLAGLAESTAFLLKTGVAEIQKREQKLSSMLIAGLQSIEGIEVFGPGESALRNAVVSFNHRDMEISDLAEALDDERIAQRMGLHCTPSAHKILGTFERGGTIRFSPGFFNTEDEIKKTIDRIRNIIYG